MNTGLRYKKIKKNTDSNIKNYELSIWTVENGFYW